MPTTMKKTCTHGQGFCPVHQGDCEIHNYRVGDGRCSCKPCPRKKTKPLSKLTGHWKEVYDRLWNLRNTNPRWELVWQEDSILGHEDYKPVVDGTMTVLPDGTLAYLFDAGPPHPRDPLKALSQQLEEGGDEEYLAKLRRTIHTAKESEKYQELLYAVARKFSGETRHQTVLRYIREAEAKASSPSQASVAKVTGKLQKASAKTTHNYRFPPPP